MPVIAEMDVKKDARNRVTLPGAAFEHYHIKAFDDGHFELYPRRLIDATISLNTLEMIDAAAANIAQGIVGPAVDPDAMLAALGEE